ncbi:MAG: stage III sporulation protein AD [Oscillospiraceae bacterium]|nr:stage III sporulation protein AD [Oscillospiraceae bacterium]MBQ6465879.1 stage III sporulation protein AD [Oscillospiraceae bacterium]
MELVLRAGALALCGAFVVLLLRRSAPELALPLSAAAVVVILTVTLGFLGGIRDLEKAAHDSFGVSDLYTQPMLKCLGIALVTRFAADLCRDASQSAAASAVELAGAACALGVVLPLLTGVLKTIGGLL